MVRIRFDKSGRVHFFNEGGLTLRVDDKVIVETQKGERLGTVVQVNIGEEQAGAKVKQRRVLRKATQVDIDRDRLLREKEKRAYELCLEKIALFDLPIKLVDVECVPDGSKLIFYFTAEHRVDFRELVKSLVRELRTRIEMRQIGVRNEAQMIGGVGSCGRELCCCSFLQTFEPVSVRMAKDQNLSLNPLKLSGVCGRLMCCLAYEHKTYVELRKDFPACKKKVSTRFGVGEVKRHNILLQRLVVELEGGNEIEIALEDVCEFINDR